MAVYGRHREKWDPKKIKAKGSKNRTYELVRNTSNVYQPEGKLFQYISASSIAGTAVGDSFVTNTGGDAIVPHAMQTEGTGAPTVVDVEAARFDVNAFSFNAASASTDYFYILPTTANSQQFTMANLFGGSRKDTYISFWIYLDRLNYKNNQAYGSSFGGLYRVSGAGTSTDMKTMRPAMLFGISSSGALELRLLEQGSTDADYSDYKEEQIVFSSTHDKKKIEAQKWHYVTIVLREYDQWALSGSALDRKESAMFFIDGEKVEAAATTEKTNTTDGGNNAIDQANIADSAELETRIGNIAETYLDVATTSAGTGMYTAGSPGSYSGFVGFSGAIGEFLIFSQDTKVSSDSFDDSKRIQLAKFLYESQVEGVYNLHSGVHSSSPRLEQFDLDNDTSYPPNFSLQAYTGFEKGNYYDADRDTSVSLRSTSRFTEGYNSGETFEEKAGKYFVNSTMNRDLESITVMPHLRLNPSDTILTNGNWYSDARSEFFAEDIDPKSGFVVSNLNAGIATTSDISLGANTVNVASTAGFKIGQKLTKISGTGSFHADGVTIASIPSATQITVSANHSVSGALLFNVGAQGISQQLTGHIPTPADEIYKEHAHTTTVAKFHDMTLGEEYKDTFVIEIPLPNASNLTLSTDQNGVGGSREKAEITVNTSTNTYDNQDSAQACNTMAYYNFSTGQWEHTVTAWSSCTNPNALGFNWQATADIGFSSMSGLVLPTNGLDLEYIMDSYGRPMTSMGFPFHKKFESAAGQAIDLSKYLDESVILEGWEISTPVIPKVGYQQESNGSAENTTADGPDNFYAPGSGGKSPFYYGAHGHACVFWDQRRNALPFEERNKTDGSDYWMVSGTVPVGGFDADGKESSPTGTAKGLVTKGVTAFLLKESTVEDTSNIYKKYVSVDKVLNVTANNIASFAKGTGYSEGTGTPSTIKKQLLPGGLSVNVATIRQDRLSDRPSTDVQYPFFSQAFYDIGSLGAGTSRFANGSARELIGYLQHVYHNDGVYDTPNAKWIDNFGKPRDYWQRNFGTVQTPDYVGAIASEAYLGVSLQNIINRENHTLVPNLLRENTDQYQLHVSGSMKGLTPYDAGYPINFFKMGSDHSGAVDTFQYVDNGSGSPDMTDNAVPYMQSYGFFPSSEGSTISEFVQRDMVPMVYGKSKSKTIALPEASLPNSGADSLSAADLASYRSAFIKSDITMSKNPNATTDVVLRPSDKLILGIQDSVSTTPLSQQSLGKIGTPDDDEFVRWGRNSLVLPANQSGYLRLFVRKTRNDKSYNVVSDESNYNHNVNRDLGDHNVGDKHRINNPTMYAGSTADDIMGPTYFTPPLMEIDVLVDTNIKDTVAVGSFYDADSHWSNAVNSPAQTGHYAPFQKVAAAAIETFNLKWYNASYRLFKNREGESALRPRYPAIDWLDSDIANYGTYTQADSDGVAAGGSGTTADGDSVTTATQSREKQWFNCSQMFQWVLADPGTGSQDGNAGVYYNALATNNNPYAQGLSTGGDFRFRNFAHPKELNTNSEISSTIPSSQPQNAVVRTSNNTKNISMMGYDCPAMSSWGLKVMLPIFSDPTDGNPLVPIPSAVNVEFRLVKILYANYNYTNTKDANGGYAKRPTFRDPTDSSDIEMKVGDAFYFFADPNDAESDDASVKKQKIIKLDLNLSTSTTPDIKQQVLRNWRGQRNAQGGPIIFIVAGQLNTASAGPGALVNPKTDATGVASAAHYQLKYKHVYSIISRILYIHSTWDSSILGEVSNQWDGTLDEDAGSEGSGNMLISTGPNVYYSHIPAGSTADGNFKISIPKDPFIRRTFSLFEEDINELMEFTLCGVKIDATTPVGSESDSVIDDNIRLYKENGVFAPISDMDFASTFDGLLQTAGTLTDGEANNIGTTNGVTHSISRTKFAGDYFTPMTANATDGDGTIGIAHNGVAVNTSSPSSGGNKITRTMYKIDYTNLVRTFPILKITKETYNESINRRIDRFVQRRTTELTNTTDETKPMVAGPFGSLQNYMQLSTRDTIYDSLPARNLWNNLRGYCPSWSHENKTTCDADSAHNWILTNYVTTLKDIPQQFPFEASELRGFTIPFIRKIKVKMNTSDPGGLYANQTSTVVITNQTLDSTIGSGTGVYDWSTSYETGTTEGEPSTKDTTEGSLGLLNLTNYIQNDFKGNVDFTRKTVHDYLVGFGDGPQGRNVIRPLIYGTHAWTSGDAKNFAQEYIIDKPRGARFGQYNTSRMRGNYIFMYNHYGHLRDMLEQPIDTRFTRGIFNESVYGSPVVVTAINIVNPESPKLLSNTSRYNKTKNATVTKPYIESGYEDIAQPTNLQNDTLRVDVPGALRSGNVLVPGNISASIRNR